MASIATRTTRNGLLAAGAAVAILAATCWAEDAAAATRRQAMVTSSVESFQLADAGPGDAGKASDGLSDATKQGIGCLATSGVLTGWSMLAGSSEVLMIVAGGMLAPSATTPIMLAFVSTLTAATCAMGAAATPAVLWAVEQSDAIGANFAWHAGNAGREIARIPERMVAGLTAAEPVRLADAPVRAGTE